MSECDVSEGDPPSRRGLGSNAEKRLDSVEGCNESQAKEANRRRREQKPNIVRIFRALKRRSNRRKESDNRQHAENERVMASWTRQVGIFTIILAGCAIANVVLIWLQLGEMHSGGLDTHNLAAAAHDQAVATGKLQASGEDQARALEKLRLAGEAQASAADKLRRAGEVQATAARLQAAAMEGLKGAGEAQARSTGALAENSGRQLVALIDSARASIETSRSVAEEERARIVAQGISIDGPVLSERDTPIRLYYANVGHKEATDFREYIETLSVANQAMAYFAGENDTCSVNHVNVGSIVGNDNTSKWISTIIPAKNISFDVISGHSTLLVRGCLTYKSGDMTHHTAFCYVALRKGVTATQGSTPLCSDSQYAD